MIIHTNTSRILPLHCHICCTPIPTAELMALHQSTYHKLSGRELDEALFSSGLDLEQVVQLSCDNLEGAMGLHLQEVR